MRVSEDPSALRPSQDAPRRYAVALALIYFIVTSVYIYFSTDWVTHFTSDARQIERLEKIKGLSFMLLTAVAFYFSVRWVSKKAAESARALRETQERWLEAERQAAPALLASVIAHDVANLLTVIRLNVERMKRIDSLEPVTNEAVAKIDHGTGRLMELVKRLRGASSSLFHEDPVRFDFSKAVSDTLSLMQSHVCCENATIEFEGETGLYLQGYPVLVHQLVMNLLINAAEATHRIGRVRVGAHAVNGGVCLAVDDNGSGIEPSLRKKVMGAFFTTKATGTGLGLTSARSCVDIHKGTMTISDSVELGGARFVITLPDLSAQRIEELRHPERLSRARSNETLLN
jgi:signal transduction histidine kinase